MRFYSAYCPEKLVDVDKILTAYRDRPDELFSNLVTKYGGPEPPAPAFYAAPREPPRKITADAAAEEALAWAAIADAACRDATLTAVVAEEFSCRCKVTGDHAASHAAMMLAWSMSLAHAAHRMVALAAQDADAAATEALSWRAITREGKAQQQSEAAAPTVSSSIAASYSMSAPSFVEKESTELQEIRRRIMEMTGQKAAMEIDMVALQAKANSLLDHADASRRELSGLNQQIADVDSNLSTRRRDALAEQHRLEDELRELREAVGKERSILGSLRSETAAAELSSKSQPQPTASEIAVSASRQLGPAPSLATGLAALQTVREQLREIREASVSPPRRLGQAATAASVTSPTTEGSAVLSPLRAMRAADAAASVNSPVSNTSSPWKARLLKLQDDLRTLRTELGAPQVGGPLSPPSGRPPPSAMSVAHGPAAY